MAVIDEAHKMNRYEYLAFVEFLDMLCRIALIGIAMDDLIEYKV